MTTTPETTTEGIETPTEAPGEPAKAAVFTLPASVLHKALKTARAIASDDPHEWMLSGVHVGTVPDRVGMVRVSATDRYASSVEHLSVTGSPFQMLIPYEETARLVELTRGLGGWQIEFTQLGNWLPKNVGWVHARVVHPEDGGELSMTFQTNTFFRWPDLEAVMGKYTETTDEAFHMDHRQVAAVCTAMTERAPTEPVKLTHKVLPDTPQSGHSERLLLLEQGRLMVGITTTAADRPLRQPSTTSHVCDC